LAVVERSAADELEGGELLTGIAVGEGLETLQSVWTRSSSHKRLPGPLRSSGWMSWLSSHRRPRRLASW
jgi:hypothetical protein